MSRLSLRAARRALRGSVAVAGATIVAIALPIVSAPTADAQPAASADLTRAQPVEPGSPVAGVPDSPEPEIDRVRPGANLARVLFTTRATTHPGRGAVVARPRPTAPLGGGPTQLRVVGQKVRRGQLYVRVLLPRRPNGRAGWISADDVVLLRTRYRIVVHRRRRTVTVTRGGRRLRRFKAVVGKPGSPTPRGEFAVSERLRQSPPDDFLGNWILPLTAFSGTYREFDGGPGRVAIHGRAGASLLDPLGTAASHGCVRLTNRAIRWIARRVSPGTPVSIR